jgi:hypothetical protein
LRSYLILNKNAIVVACRWNRESEIGAQNVT